MSEMQQMRASDRDREQVVARLRAALEEGRLKLEEYVDRMERACQAVTFGDLAPLCADLPPAGCAAGQRDRPVAATVAPAVARPEGVLAGLPVVLKVLWTIWFVAVSVNVITWALVSGAGGHLAYPWPVWVAGPYGAVLFAVSAAVMMFRHARPAIARR
jgi:Domain of unknown function (DUF1707)